MLRHDEASHTLQELLKTLGDYFLFVKAWKKEFGAQSQIMIMKELHVLFPEMSLKDLKSIWDAA